MKVNNIDLELEVDTGASASIISEKTYRGTWREDSPTIRKTAIRLKTYTGEQLHILGVVEVRVEYLGQKEKLPLLVIAGAGPTLLGRDRLQKVKLDWRSLDLYKLRASTPSKLQEVLQQHEQVFRDELGKVTTTTAKIHVDADAQPRFHKPRLVPYAMREKVDQELQRLEERGIIEPVEFSEWAAPIVPVVKEDGSIRICGDYRATVNQVAKLDTYPLLHCSHLWREEPVFQNST